MYIYLVTARSDTSTAVNFPSIFFVDSRSASKLFRIQVSFFPYLPFSKNLHPQLLYYLPLFIRILVKKFIYYFLLLNQYTNKLAALLSTSKTWNSLRIRLIIPPRLSVAACWHTKFHYDGPILLRLRGPHFQMPHMIMFLWWKEKFF